MREATVSVRDLRKSYGAVEAVRGLSFEIAGRRVLRPAGPERRGQDDHDRDPRRPARPDLGRGGRAGPPLGRATTARSASAWASACSRPCFSEKLEVRRDGRALPRPLPRGPRPADGDRRGRPRREGAARASARSPAASSSGSRWPAPSWATPSSSSSTSRRPGLDPQSRRQVWDIVNGFKARRPHRAPHHALHGRGRAALRPDRDHRPRRGSSRRARRAS